MTITKPYEALLSATPAFFLSYTHQGNSVTAEELAFGRLQHLTVEREVHNINDNQFELLYTVKTHDEETIEFRHMEFTFPMNLTDQIMMADGFQCWTHSRELDLHGRLPPISKTVAWWTKFNLQGDYNFFQYTGTAGVIHSNSYTYLRDEQDTVLIGSVSEDSGYTYFKADYNTHRFSIYKDIQGKTLSGDESIKLRFMITRVPDTNAMDTLWQRYAEYYGRTSTKPRHLTGWTSWYNYYERVTEADVTKSLEGFIDQNYPIDVFQIDDGYQKAVGDWLDVATDKFPSGMQSLANQIKKAGYIPGLWLAPYAVGFTSKIVKEHPEWLIKNPDGSLLVAGPNWGGFYALDMYHPEARDYLRRVFDTVLDDWGYGLIKLDFIFAAAMIPRHGKSRGEILWESVQMIDELTKKRALILGSGVPLAATWNRFEYCRVSSDASPFWDHTVLKLSNVRERVATSNALTSTLHRWPMKHMFGVDPDVFFLRANDNKLTPIERYTTCMINSVMGHLTLMSDDITQYDEKQHRLYASTFPKVQPDIQRMVPIGPNVYRTDFVASGRQYTMLVNLSPMPFTTDTLDNKKLYFENQNVLTVNGTTETWIDAAQEKSLTLKPHETRTFLHISDRFAGSTGHLVPGWEIDMWNDKKETIHVGFRKNRKAVPSSIFLLLQPEEALPTVFVDEEPVVVQEHTLPNSQIRLAKLSID